MARWSGGRFALAADDTGEELVECSGKSCRSCSAIALADCIALCCCPCSVVSLLVLAFLKVPWVMGRRFLRLLRKKWRVAAEGKVVVVVERDVRGEFEGEVSRLGMMDGGENGNWCARFEAERVWMELYQAGQLGFGRVSFTGMPG